MLVWSKIYVRPDEDSLTEPKHVATLDATLNNCVRRILCTIYCAVWITLSSFPIISTQLFVASTYGIMSSSDANCFGEADL
jgi:hypothetical protein